MSSYTTFRGRTMITVTGAEATMAVLKTIDPTVYKRLDAQLRRAAQVVARQAAGTAPVRSGDMRGGYRAKKASSGRRGASKFAIGYKVINLTPEGSLLEFAGRVSDGSSPQGRSLIANLTQKYGRPGRFAWAAYDKNESQLEQKLGAAVRAAEAEVQARLNTI